MLKDDKAPEIRRVTLLIPVSVHQAHGWCSLRVSVVALLSRGTCACLLTPELVRRSPPKHLPPALRSVRTTLSVRSIAVAHMQAFYPLAA